MFSLLLAAFLDIFDDDSNGYCFYIIWMVFFGMN